VSQPDNPFAVQAEDKTSSQGGLSPAAKALSEILQERSAYVAQGVTVRSNDGESGLSKLTDVEAPLEVNLPVGDNRVALRVTPVSLNAGGVGNSAKERFGGFSSTDLADFKAGNFSADNLPTDKQLSQVDSYIHGPTGHQKDRGVGVSVALDRPAAGLKSDIGVSPQGFQYSTVVGGVSLERPITNDVSYKVSLSRRPVTDSLVSFAGARDGRSGVKWGGVTANGGRAQLSYDDGQIGLYGYGSLHELTGHNVKSNTRAEGGAGAYWYVINEDSQLLTAGLSLTALGYDNNQNNFTYGNGGYFSPQNFFSIAVPVRWAQRTQHWSYSVSGALGVQHFEQDSEPYFPNDKEEQKLYEQAAALVGGVETHFDGSKETGIGYNLRGAAEYQLNQNFFMGGHLGVDNAQDYRQWNGGLYLRYMFEDMSGPLALPVSPFTSPYSN
jgi:hypothetical protein